MRYTNAMDKRAKQTCPQTGGVFYITYIYIINATPEFVN
nr:MAG TPA: hypothetical protein [Caudoviricetes sp.]